MLYFRFEMSNFIFDFFIKISVKKEYSFRNTQFYPNMKYSEKLNNIISSFIVVIRKVPQLTSYIILFLNSSHIIALLEKKNCENKKKSNFLN